MRVNPKQALSSPETLDWLVSHASYIKSNLLGGRDAATGDLLLLLEFLIVLANEEKIRKSVSS